MTFELSVTGREPAMKRALAILVVVLAIGCSDRRSPTAPSQAAASTQAPPTATNVLRGTVTDSGGAPVPGATVAWAKNMLELGEVEYHAQTNERGEYRSDVGSLPSGGYPDAVARASKDGFDSQTKSVAILGVDTVLDFTINRFSANGTLTLVSARAQPLCPEVSRRVGTTTPLWLVMKADGASVTLTLSQQEPPGNDLGVAGAYVFAGTRSASEITATSQGQKLFSCPSDTTVTYQNGGVLRAIVSGSRLSGEYTETYGAFGSGDAQVTLVYRFEATI